MQPPQRPLAPIKYFTGCLLLCLLLSAGRLWAAAETRIVNFTIFLKNDLVLNLDSREKRLNIERSAFDIIVYEKQGDVFKQVRKIAWPDITRNIYAIDLINRSLATYSKAKLLLTRQDGTQTVIQFGSLYDTDGTLLDAFHYSEYNRVAGRWTRQQIPVEDVRKLVLGTNQLMINSKTGKLFPPDYRYDPYTGDPLAESALTED